MFDTLVMDMVPIRDGLCFSGSQDSVVGVTTCYRLNGPFQIPVGARSRLAPRPTQPPVQWVPCLFLRVKAARAWF
jgi:hypothetical protein